MLRTLDAALRAVGATVAEAREALDYDPASLPSHLVAVGDLVADAMAALLRSEGERAMQSEVAGELATIMQAVRDALRALKGDGRENVADALGVITAAVGRALYTWHKAAR